MTAAADPRVEGGEPVASPADAATPRRPSLDPTRIITGVILVMVGILWGAERAEWIDLSATAVLALATCAVGIAAMVRSLDGEHVGLIAFGIVLAALAALTAAAPIEGFQGGLGDRTVEVATASELQSHYELGAGKLVIDLRALDDSGDVEKVTANVLLGDLVILVPQGVALDIDARAGAGDLDVLDQSSEGVLVDDDYRSPDYDTATNRLAIEANVLVGSVEVTEG